MAPIIESGRPRERDLLAQVGPSMYRAAYEKGRNLSVHLEAECPSEPGDQLDTFERMLDMAGIVSRSIPQAGVWASPLSDLEDGPARMLVPELLSRMWREVSFGGASTRALYTSADDIPGSLAHSYADAMQARQTQQIAPAIPLASLVAVTTPISTDAYRAYYLTVDATNQRQQRVGEGANLPQAKLLGGDHTILLQKYGRSLIASYETLRRSRIDKVRLWVQLLAAQTESDKVAALLAVVENGDGNASTAATSYNLTALDSATVAGTPSLAGWVAFKLKFANPYQCLVAITTETIAKQLLLLNSGSANIPAVVLAGQGGMSLFRPINPGLADGTGLGWDTNATANKVVAMDTRWAVERVTEIGANIQEVERYATNQTQSLNLSEVEGYAIFDPAASRVLVVNA